MYQIAFIAVIGSMAFWGGMALMAVTMLGINLVTIRFQIIAPTARRKKVIKRLTGIPTELLSQTLEPWQAAGWHKVLHHETGVRMNIVILERYEYMA